MARGKGVWLAVYVEGPRRRRLVSRNQQQHLHHHHHLYVRRARQLAGNDGGYNRKSALLEYSRQLRESARSQASSSPLLHRKPASHDHHQHLTQIVPVKRRPKRVRSTTPTCLDWKILIPSFVRSLVMPGNKKEKKKKKKAKTNDQSSATKMRTVMKRFQVAKQGGFLSKMLASLGKHR